ncbi:S9 family peptidase [Streptomyces carminius]|uniref:S9 family peptidase n=1 Tax=Streptomyces carminius TaxID=2665496 RepID=A0A2M8LTP6_9ACTN|nr:alpha/beta fold hydrolase [Streptomyces carminius]PJE95320.1 S9 family peptidase [Streptomyces carminius]
MSTDIHRTDGAAADAGTGLQGAGYHVQRPVLPEVCPRDPALMAFTGDADGRCEVFAFDARTGTARQVTDRPRGTLHCAIDADAAVWWFAEDEAGRGHWYFQDFHGGPARPGLAGLPTGTPRGLVLGADATVAVGLGHGSGLTVCLGRRGGTGRRVLRAEGYAVLAGLSPDGRLLAVARAAASGRAVTVHTADGGTAAVLSGRDGGLWALGFAPRSAGDTGAELLLIRRLGDRYVPAVWREADGIRLHEWCAFDTEITARWYPEGGRLLIRQDRHGRSRLFTADLGHRTLTPLPVPPGSVLDAVPRPGGDVHYLWTDTATPLRAYSTAGTPLPGTDLPAVRVPGHHTELWTPGPEGPVHTLLSLPERPARPPLVLLVHGGPADHDRDAYDPVVHSLVASGFAVARVNYRGSTGYGPRWREAFGESVGLAQVADLAAVRADVLERGLADPGAVGLWGTSWGGYLVLLALGTRPGLWQAGVAVKPLADCATAHRAGTPALRALDEALFGGTPEQVPERYARSSPIRYADRVRAPLLMAAATHDAKCPPEQVRTYLAALRACGVRHEEMWLDSGHDGYLGSDHVAVLRRGLGFLDRELRGSGRTALHDPPPRPGRGPHRPSGTAAGDRPARWRDRD